MPLAFTGRVEALCTVPSGGAAVSATIANGGVATACTVPAASYYLTAAGGVSSLITTLQTQLNENSQGYAQTAAAMNSACQNGTWSIGWLFNEASGNLAPVFGATTLSVASGPITYGTAGPRGGIDKAIGFDTNTDQLSGGNILDVAAGADLLIAMVVKMSAGANGDFLGKGWAGGTGYLIARETNAFSFYARDGVDTIAVGGVANGHVGKWCVLLACIDRGANRMRTATKPLDLSSATVVSSSVDSTALGSISNASNFVVGSSGAYGADMNSHIAALYVGTGVGAAAGADTNLSAMCDNLVSAINAAWTVSLDTSGGTGRVSIGWTGYTTPTWSLSWTNTTLRDVLGFTGDISGVTTTQTGTKQARGLWFPDCPLNLDSDPRMAPRGSDLRTSRSPTGVVLGLCGNEFYEHTGLVYSHVPIDRIREESVTHDNASLEVFWRDTQTGQGGVSWFTPASEVQIYYDHAGTQTAVGSDASISGWAITGVAGFKDAAKMIKGERGYTGLWRVEFPAIVSDG